MESSFRRQILVDKLSKLNSSQQSIETLSHWCIFHMNKAKHVVETWEKQFHCAPREQRLAFLYLANDIIQNSRRKGAEFVAEFYKVLPGALRDVIENGDDFGRNAALRLISIWEERKVFGSRGQIRREDFLQKKSDDGTRHWNHVGVKLQQSQSGDPLDKLVSGYHAVLGCKLDMDMIINRCRNSAGFIDKVELDIEQDCRLGNINSGVTMELKEQRAALSECIQQLGLVESSRSNLVFLLREALQEQEYKLDQIRHHIQEARKQSERADSICSRLRDGNGAVPDPAPPQMPPDFVPLAGEQLRSPVQTSGSMEDPKSAAAAVAAKLAASTSSAEMLTLVLNSLASEGVISNSSDYSREKRAKLDEEPVFLPPPPSQQYSVPEYVPSVVPALSGQYGGLVDSSYVPVEAGAHHPLSEMYHQHYVQSSSPMARMHNGQ